MLDFSPVQIVIVLLVALVIFGPKRLPDLGRNLGRGLHDFKSGITGEDDHRPHPTPGVEAGSRTSVGHTTAKHATHEQVSPERPADGSSLGRHAS